MVDDDQFNKNLIVIEDDGFKQGQTDDPLSFLLSPAPVSKEKEELVLPFPKSSFAADRVFSWLNEADRIESGELQFPGQLGSIIAAANRRAASEALANPARFLLLTEFLTERAGVEESQPRSATALLNRVEKGAVACESLTPAQAAEIQRRMQAIRLNK